MENKHKLNYDFLILGVSFIVGVIIFSMVWKSNQSSNQTITVTGSAKKEIVSDLGILRGSLVTDNPNPADAYADLMRNKTVVVKYLNSKGIQSDKIEFETINSYPVYEYTSTGMQTARVLYFVYSQRLRVESNDVNKIKEISLDITSLIQKGVNFSVDPPEYHYTKLADLKIEIQAEAAKDAMIRAQKIADATDRSLGPMRTARMGVLQILPKYSNAVSDYGINDLSSIVKEIIGVVNASFQID